MTITVAAPVANAESYTMTANTTLTVDAPGVLANDTSPFGTPLTFIIASYPADGTLSISSDGDGSFSYLPATNFVGTDTFTYEATDGIATSAGDRDDRGHAAQQRDADQDGHHDRRDLDRHLRWQGYDIVGRPSDLPRA